MLNDGQFGKLTAARITEFLGWSTPWQRRLWNIGTVAGLRELLEASTANSNLVLVEAAVKALQNDLQRSTGADPAIGSQTERTALTNLLKGDLRAGRVGWLALRSLSEVVEDGYLKRWADLIRSGTVPGSEATARLIAAHWLHLGYSSRYLHRWLTFHVRHNPDSTTFADIMDIAAVELAGRELRTYEVLMPVISAPRINPAAPPDAWRSARQVSELIAGIEGSDSDVRQGGGFFVRVESLDPEGAVAKAQELMDRWAARTELATRDALLPLGRAWVRGVSTPFPMSDNRRGVDIGTLGRENQIYAELGLDNLSLRLDDAFQLLQPLETGPKAAAIAGGWGAIESLLTAPGEAKTLAASRMASIVACSFPRAELTTLSYMHVKNSTDVLSKQLVAESQNRRRAALMAQAIRDGATIATKTLGDEAAVQRMKLLIEQPAPTLGRIRVYIESAMNRLYRQRNLIVHGGLVAGDGRSAILATAPPLVGAGMDRIAHAWLTEQTPPLELAARAELNLELVGPPGAPGPDELLEAR